MTLETGLALLAGGLSVGSVVIGVLRVGRLIGNSETQIKADVQAVKVDVQSVKVDVKRIGDKAAGEITEFREANAKDLKSLAEAQTASISRMEAGIKADINHQTAMASLRHDELSGRVGRVEHTLASITKVVVNGGPST